MSIWSSIMGMFAAGGPADDRYYQPVGIAAAGQRVSPESAVQVATVYACIRVLAETIGSIPLIVNRRLPSGDKERVDVRSAPPDIAAVAYLLQQAPNPYLTTFRWRETGMRHLCLRGNSYSRVKVNGNGIVTSLTSMAPDRVTPRLYDDGSIRYDYRATTRTETLLSDEVLHIRGLSDDGVVGLSPIAEQRITLGSAQAVNDYGARFFENDVRPGVHFKHPGKLGDVAYKRLKDELNAAYAGANRFKPALLEEGMDIVRLGVTNEEAQFLETRRLSREEICAVFRVPQHLAGILDRSTFSNIEHQAISFVTHTVVPYCVRWEQEINSHPALLGAQDEFFAEFNVDALLRGDLAARYAAYATGRNWGWLSANDVRRRENMNSIGEQGDRYLEPLNTSVAGDKPETAQVGPGNVDDVKPAAILELVKNAR